MGWVEEVLEGDGYRLPEKDFGLRYRSKSSTTYYHHQHALLGFLPLALPKSFSETLYIRDAKWSESIAVGSKSFVEKVEEKLGIRAIGRGIVGTEAGYELCRIGPSFSLTHKGNFSIVLPIKTNVLSQMKPIPGDEL